MPIRDIFVTFVVFVCLPFILANPYVGIYVWSWMSYMNPHRLSWGFAFDFPFAYIIALTTLSAMLFSREPKQIPWTRETLLLLGLILWMLVTTIFAFHQELAWLQMEKIVKIQLMIFLTLMLITTRERLQTLVWVIALSLAFYGVKGGLFTILHGGVYNVRGPLQTFIGGDNEIGLALIMTIPLLRYLQLTTNSKWIRFGLTAAMILSAIAVIGSQSRGALLGATVMGGFLWLKSRNKFFTGLVIAVSATMILTIMPQQWFERMSTIKNYEQDESALGRINAWKMAFNLASDRPLVGGGFETFQRDTFSIYAPDPNNVHAAHSLYFQVLGEHGFVGLALYLALGIAAWRTGAWVIKAAKQDQDQRWAADLAAMTQVSMVGFASAGAFLGLANFDLYYHMLCLIIICKLILLKEQARQGQLGPHPVRENASFKRREPQVENG